MKLNLTSGRVTVALAAIAALAVVSPALGGSSLRSLVKKEVAKQLASSSAVSAKAKRGPRGRPGRAGANGINGANGANGASGANGTARAYAKVEDHVNSPCAPGCTFDRSKGVTSVTRVATGTYCVTVPGIDPASVPAAVTVEWDFTGDPEGNVTATTRATAIDCAGQFEVITERLSVSGATDAAPADDVGFTIVIP